MSNNINIDKKVLGDLIRETAKMGGDNKLIDTEEETSVFIQKLESKGVKNASQIINDYKSNTMLHELQFSLYGQTRSDKSEYMIYSALNGNSFLRSNEQTQQEVKSIIKDVKDAVNYFWGTDEEKLNAAVGRINSGNVMQVLNAKYENDETFIEAIVDDVSQDELNQYGKTIINALVQAAIEKKIDVSDLVALENDEYITTGNIPGVKADESAYDEDNLEKVVYALRDRINSQVDMVTKPENAKKDKGATLTQLTLMFDANNNGSIDGEEVSPFKAACAKLGIIINDILNSINKKSESNGALTKEEEIVKNIFDTSYNMNKEIETSRSKANTVSSITTAIKNKDKDALRSSFSIINADNVEDFLTELDKNAEFMNLAVGETYAGSYTGTAGISYSVKTAVKSDKNDIGAKLVQYLGSDAEEFNKVIVSALYSKAQDNYIDVSDIVKTSSDGFETPNGKNALDSKNVNSVIENLRSRIKQELGE